MTPFPDTAGLLQQLQTAGDFPLMFVWQAAAGPAGVGAGFMLRQAMHGIRAVKFVGATYANAVPVPCFVTAPVLRFVGWLLL